LWAQAYLEPYFHFITFIASVVIKDLTGSYFNSLHTAAWLKEINCIWYFKVRSYLTPLSTDSLPTHDYFITDNADF